MRRTAVALAALLLAAGTSPALAGGGVPKLANLDAGPHPAELFNDSPSLVTGTNGLTLQIRGLTAEHVVSLTLEGPDGARVPVPLTRVIVLGELGGDEHSNTEGGDDHGSASTDDHASAAPGATAQKVADPHGIASADSHGASDAHGSPTGAQPLAQNARSAPSSHETARSAPSVPAAHGAGQPVDAHAATGSVHDDGATDNHSAALVHEGEAVEAHGHATETEAYLARGSVSLPTTGIWTAHLTIRDPNGQEVVGEAPLAVVEGGPSKLYLGFTGSLIFGSMLFGFIQRRHQPTRSQTTR